MIRLTETKDLAKIVSLENAIMGRDYITAQDLTESVWWVAKVDGELAGYCGVRPSSQDELGAYLIRAGVLGAYRGQGLHRRMLRKRLNWACKCGYATVYSDTAPHNVWSSNNLITEGFRLFVPDEPWSQANQLYWLKSI